MFRIHPTLFDIIIIFLISFMLIAGLMIKDIKQEYLMKIDMFKKAFENRYSNTSDTDTIILTVIPEKGDYKFILSSKKIGQKIFSNVSQIKKELSRLRPAKISLRVDRSVPTGITQELIYDAQKLGILTYLAVEKG